MTFPLTDFIIAIGKAPRADLARTNTDAAARKYGIQPAHAAQYIAWEIAR